MKKRLVITIGVLVLLSSIFTFAQEETTDKPQPIDITAARVEYFEKNDTEVTRFSGGVTFKAASYRITADQVEVFQGGEKLTAEGNINIFYHDKEKKEKGEAKGGHLEYDRKSGYLVMTRSPFIKIDQPASAENPSPRKIEISAAKIELWTEKQLALASGNARISQTKFLASGEEARFFLAEEKVVLTGSPQITRGEDTFSGEKITIFIQDGKMIIEGNVKGQVTSMNEKTKQNQPEVDQP